MKFFWLLFVFDGLICPVWAQAPDEVRYSYLKAEACYETGEVEEALRLLEENFSAYEGAMYTGACRLAALCLLAMDRFAEADDYVALLLKDEPYYYLSLQDPVRFADLVKKHREAKTTLVTASQQVETPEEAPVPVTLITEEMIQATGAQCLQEVLLAYVPGLTALGSNEEMNMAMRGVYGSGQEHILIMRDGQRLNSYITNAVSADYGMSLAKIKQIEVLRGPASSLYGSVALTAVINLVTKEGADVAGSSLSLGTGNHGQFALDLLFGRHAMEGDILFWFSLFRADGEPVFIPQGQQYAFLPADGNIVLDHYSGFPAMDGGCKWQKGNFLFTIGMNYAKKRQPYSMWLFASPYSYSKFRTFDGAGPGYARWCALQQIAYSRSFRQLALTAAFYSGWNRNVRYETAGDTLQEYGIPNGYGDTLEPRNGVFQYLRWEDFHAGFTTRVNYHYHGGKFGQGDILGGLEWNGYSLYDSEYAEGMNFTRIVRTWTEKRLYMGRESNINAFLQVKHRLGAQWIFNAGIRYDYKKRCNRQIIQAFSPRLSLIYAGNGLNLKCSYSKSFVDAPYYYRNNDMDTYSGGQNLKPEYLRAWQLTTAYRFRAFPLETEWNFFYNRASHFLYTQPETRIYENAGLLDMAGMEMTALYKSRKIRVETAVTYQRVLKYANFFVTGGHVDNVPDLTVNLNAGYHFLQKEKRSGSAHVRMRAGNRCYTLVNVLRDGLDGEATPLTLRLPGYATFSFTTCYRYKRASGSLCIDNLFNRRYECGGAAVPIRQKGRWVFVKLTRHF